MIKIWKKYYLICLLLISIITIIHAVIVINANLGVLRRGEAGIALFYGIQLFGTNEHICHLITMLVFIPVSCFWIFIYAKNSPLFNMWLVRVGKKAFLKQAALLIALGAVCMHLVQVILELSLINFVFAPISLEKHSFFLKNGLPAFFSDNGLLNLGLYILCSTLGCVVCALLCFAVCLFVKKLF